MDKNPNISIIDISKQYFGNDFVWGVSTAAYQIEGAYKDTDKGTSIWDKFTSNKKNIYKGQHANVTCDFFNRYEDDILLMKSMNIPNFRFSISWSRLMPNGQGAVSKHGLEFYNKVINFCLKCGITPWITLYHWDLPQALEDKGGWTNREIVAWFEEYTTVCANEFGDRVKHWMVMNEPMVFTGAGYFLGVHAPGKKGMKYFLPAVHHAVLSQAAGGRILRSVVKNSCIGTTFSCSHITPFKDSEKHILAAKRVDALLNRLFIEPSLGLGYPIKEIPSLKKIKKYQYPEDAGNSIFEFDFIGVQNYTREVVKHSWFVPYLKAKIINARKRKVVATLMDWEVYPKSIFEMIKKFNSYKGLNKIIITENGAAFNDFLENEFVDDRERLTYIQSYIQQLYKAKTEGLKIDGYFIWTFTDNFEWAEGYYPRFGLVHVDFDTQKRIVKNSGRWYADFLKGKNINEN
jgi:beta-glucosidase